MIRRADGMDSGGTTKRPRVNAARLVAASVAALSLACTPTPATRTPDPPPQNPDASIVARAAPISLTATDGTALNLRSVAVRSSIDEPLAFTELELVFDNPEGRQLDGRLTVALPNGARLTRFARAAGADEPWLEAEVVPRRTAYAALKKVVGAEEPALAVRGGNLIARVDAIAAREPTRLVLAYVQELRGRGDSYRVPLAGLPSLRELTLRVNSRTAITLGGDALVQKAAALGTPYGPPVRFTNYRPTRDLTVNFSGPRELGLRRDEMVVARLAPVPHDHPAPLDSLTILFDTSASQALGFEAQVDRLRDVLAAIDRRLAADIPLRVLAFDQTVETVFEGRLGAFGEAELSALRSRGAFGASNLASALRVAASHGEARYQRLLLMTDGAFTAGPTGAATLRAEAARLLDAGVVRVDVLSFGGHGDAGLLRDLTASAPNHRGLVLHGDLSADSVALKLHRGVVHDVTVAVEGSAWVYPEKIDALQAGDDVLIYAGLDEGAPRWDRFAVHLSGGEHLGRDFPVSLVETRSPLLKDAWSGARASWLIDQARRHCLGDDRSLCDKWRQRALEWSVSKRVINDLTAMVVLPSHAADFARFASRSPGAEVSLDPADLPAFLAVGKDGLEWAPRELIDESAPRLGSAEAYPLRFDLSPGPWWDAPAAPPSPAVRQPDLPRSLVRRPKKVAPRPVREDSSVDVPAPIPDAELPDKDAGGPRPGPHRTPEDAYEGNFLTVMNLLSTWNAKGQALDVARRWHNAQPGDVMALVALGQALEAHGRGDQAARAYGSIIDLYPARADMRRLAASRLERLGEPHQWLAIDAYGRAIEQRSDDPAGYRLYAYALLRADYYREAFEALVDGLAWARSDPRTRPLEKVLTGDLGLVAAAWIRRWPEQADYVKDALKIQEVELPTTPSLRFVLSWDSELADLDLHVRDGLGWHAFYRHKALDSGGSLSDDMDAGYGLEAFVIDGPATAFPYRLEVGYYARGAAHGGGKLEVVEHDGNGQLFFDQRPFVVLKQRAHVDLGVITASPSQTPPAR